MNNDLINENDIRTTPPSWQHPVLPSPAVQGSLLLTTNDFTTPPQDSSLFKFIPMEKLIGVANVKMEYNDVLNKFTIYKAKGHLYNNDQWDYEWEAIGSFENITPEAQEQLLALVYVNYRYDTSVQNNLKVYGIKKNGEEDLLCNIQFINDTVFNQAIQHLQDEIDDINASEVQGGLATDITTDSQNVKHVNVRYDGNDFTVDTNNNLKSNIIDDTSTTTKGWSAQKIIEYLSLNAMKFSGAVQNRTYLPATANKNDVYLVESENDLFVNISNTSTPNWQPFTEIAETVNNYAIELHKSANGLYGQLRYDTIDFIVDNFNNLKSQLIDDTLDGSSPNANRKTYSIVKILQLISQAMHYKGQVATYNDLPATGNVSGDVWNVQDTGDNYAWNGTGWDDLSGEYIAGAGIVINGKTISATGISFIVGSGLQATGSGSTTTLLTKNGNGIEYDNGGAIQVKKGSGVSVNANGVNVNTGNTTKLVNDNVEVDYSDGLTQDANNKLVIMPKNGLIVDSNGVGINANFNIKQTPLGTDSSKLALYSDGKIGVDFTESPVVLVGEKLYEANLSLDTNYLTNIVIPNMNSYDMFYMDHAGLFGQYFQKSTDGDIVRITAILPNSIGNPGSTPSGAAAYLILCRDVNFTKGTISRMDMWSMSTWGTWAPLNATTTSPRKFRIYGMKAR